MNGDGEGEEGGGGGGGLIGGNKRLVHALFLFQLQQVILDTESLRVVSRSELVHEFPKLQLLVVVVVSQQPNYL